MPAIGHADNLIKLKVSCECTESHDEFDDCDDDAFPFKKQSQVFNPNDHPSSVILQPTRNVNPFFSLTVLCFLLLWFTLAFWFIVVPPNNSNDLLYHSCSKTCDGEGSLIKSRGDVEKFHELSSLYGRYFNISDDKINYALRDPDLWLVIFRLICDEGMIEQDKPHIRGYFEQSLDHKTDRLRVLADMLGIEDPMLKISNDGINEYNHNKKKFHLVEGKLIKEDILPPIPRLSFYRDYSLHDKVFVGREFHAISKNSQITLTTQSSVDRLKSFAFSASKWTGPISLAVFVDGFDQYCTYKQYLRYLHLCKEDILNRTLISIATPEKFHLDNLPSCRLNTSSCSSLETLIAAPDPEKSSTSQGPGYPQNTMRNLARYNSPTPYHLMLDIDIIPSAKMSESLNRFLVNKPVFKNGLVIPTYEVSVKAKFPENKAELVNLRSKGQAQPFHKDLFLMNQNATDFTRWEKIHDTYDDVSIVYNVEHSGLYYEPFFVEHRCGPRYDESFIGYGFTRSSHALEMYMSNGDFQVLSPVFTVQLGLQKVKEWSPERQKQNTHNNFIFQRFVGNLNRTRYDWTLSPFRIPPPRFPYH